MKRIWRRTFVLLVILVLLVATAVTTFAAEDVDFDKYIAEYENDTSAFKSKEVYMNVGEERDLDNTGAFDQMTLYSSDEAVVAIEGLCVKAVGEGTAYVAYFMDGDYLYLRCYHVGQYSKEEHIQLNGYDKLMAGLNSFQGVFTAVFYVGIIILIILIIAIIIEVKAHQFSKQTLGRKELPAMRTTDRTVTTPAYVRTTCPTCGQAFDDTAFCGNCGTPKQAKNVYQFAIRHKMYATDFEKMVNEWLAENPHIYNCKLNVSTDWSFFAISPRHKFFVTKASIEFNVSDKPLNYRYGVAFVYKKRYFGFGNGEALVDKWLENNGDCKPLSWDNSRITHWDNNALTYSLHYNIVFFKKPVISE